MTEVQLADDFLDLAALGGTHVHLARYIRGVGVRRQGSLETRHGGEVWGVECGARMFCCWGSEILDAVSAVCGGEFAMGQRPRSFVVLRFSGFQ